MGHGVTLKWMYQRAQAVAALRAQGREVDVHEALTGRVDEFAFNNPLHQSMSTKLRWREACMFMCNNNEK